MVLQLIALSLCINAAAGSTTKKPFTGLHVPRCPSDYPDITNGVAYWWNCCSECPGLAYCTITCCCACQRADVSSGTGTCLVGHPIDLQGNGADETAAVAVRTAGGPAALLPVGGAPTSASSGTSSGVGGSTGTSGGSTGTSGGSTGTSGGTTGTSGGTTGTSGGTTGSSGGTSGTSGGTSGASAGSSGASSGSTSVSGGTTGTVGGTTGVTGGTSGSGAGTSSTGTGAVGGTTGVSGGTTGKAGTSVAGGVSGGTGATTNTAGGDVTFTGTLMMILNGATQPQVESATASAIAGYLGNAKSVTVQGRLSRRLALSRRLSNRWLLTYRAVVAAADADVALAALQLLSSTPSLLENAVRQKLPSAGVSAAASQTLQVEAFPPPRKTMSGSYYTSIPATQGGTTITTGSNSRPSTSDNQLEGGSEFPWGIVVVAGVGGLLCLMATGFACMFIATKMEKVQTQIIDIMEKKDPADNEEYVMENGVLVKLEARTNPSPSLASEGPQSPTMAMLNMAKAARAADAQPGPVQASWDPRSASRGPSPAQSTGNSPAASRNPSPRPSPRENHHQTAVHTFHTQVHESTLRIPLSSSRTPSKDSRQNSLPPSRSASKDHGMHSSRRASDSALQVPSATTASPRPISAGSHGRPPMAPHHSPRGGSASLSLPGSRGHAHMGPSPHHSPRGTASLSLPGARSRSRSPAPTTNDLRIAGHPPSGMAHRPPKI